MKKKIAHVTFDMRIGGAERVICNLIENSDKSKYDLSIICIDSEIGPFGRQLREKGYEIISFGRKPGFDRSLIRDMHSYIKQNNIDVLHCHQYTPYIYGLFAALLTKTRVIFTEHGRFYPDERKIKRFLINPFLSLFTDYITAISAATRDALVKFENFSQEKISVVYNGIGDTELLNDINLNLKDSLGIEMNTKVIGTVARLDPIKNQKMMIRALKMILSKYPATVMIIIGDGPERSNLEALAKELDVKSRLLFTGFKDDVQNYIKLMDIFLLTSFSEGTAMTLLEAMSLGVPCIATDVGGNPEIVKDGETGFLVPSDDVETLAEKIALLFDSPDLKLKMGKAGKERFDKYFSVNKMIYEYEKLYEA